MILAFREALILVAAMSSVSRLPEQLSGAPSFAAHALGACGRLEVVEIVARCSRLGTV